MKPVVAASLGMLVLTTIAASRLGGWAVVSVTDPPTHLMTGAPNSFEFEVRQHGEQALEDLKPRVSARSGMHFVMAQTSETRPGTYRSTLNIPAAPRSGEWRVQVEAGFGRSRGIMAPLRAVAAGTAAPRLSEGDRGRQLFAAKGCVTCHVHSAIDIEGEAKAAGPDLSNRRFPAEYLRSFLTDPSIKTVPGPDGRRMPNPRLRASEITALVAFINGPSQVAQP